MDVLTPERLAALVAAEDDRLVSIYLPTHRAGAETRQDPIRLKNLLGEAEAQLAALGLSDRDASAVLDPARRRLDDYDFWQRQSDGLALFCGSGALTELRLPAPFDELVVVGERFHVKPLLPVLDTGRVFFVLALSENEVRLLQGTRSTVADVAADAIPASLAEALWYEDPERSLQQHSTSRGGGKAVFHGHGLGEDDTDDRRRRFLRAVDDGVRHVVGDAEAPLVLAATERNQAAYRQVTRHPDVLDAGIDGNPEDLSADELHTRAWRLVSDRAEAERAAEAARYEGLSGTGQTTAEPAEAALAAHDGRVATLFVRAGSHAWGKFDAAARVAEPSDERRPGDRDLLDAAATATWRMGGRVFVPPEPDLVPGGGDVAAIFRY